MTAINPYLSFSGNAEEAFEFYRSVFGGDFLAVMRWSDNPDAGDMPAGDQQKIMHVALPLGDGQVLMGADSPESMGGPLQTGNNFAITIEPDSEEEARRLFDGLAAGGQVTMPLEQTFWGALFGMFTDKYGIRWMVNYTTDEQG